MHTDQNTTDRGCRPCPGRKPGTAPRGCVIARSMPCRLIQMNQHLSPHDRSHHRRICCIPHATGVAPAATVVRRTKRPRRSAGPYPAQTKQLFLLPFPGVTKTCSRSGTEVAMQAPDAVARRGEHGQHGHPRFPTTARPDDPIDEEALQRWKRQASNCCGCTKR